MNAVKFDLKDALRIGRISRLLKKGLTKEEIAYVFREKVEPDRLEAYFDVIKAAEEKRQALNNK